MDFYQAQKSFQECITQKDLLIIKCLFRTLSEVKIFRQPVKNMAQVYSIIELLTPSLLHIHTIYKEHFNVLSVLLATEILRNGPNYLKLNHPKLVSSSGFC